jgi:competence protein ComEC
MTDRMFYYCFVSFALAIAWQSFFTVWNFVPIIVFGSSLIFLVYAKIGNKYGIIFRISALLFFVSLGLWRFQLVNLKQEDRFITERLNQEVEVVGVVAEEPEEKEDTTRYVVHITSLGQAPVDSRVLVTVSRFPKFTYGDRVALQGVITKPKNFDIGDGRTFDYESYLKKNGIYYIFYRPKITFLESGKGSPVKLYLFKVKEMFLSEITTVLPEPHATLMGGLLLGDKSSLNKELENEFRRAGVIHIIVLSGYNITLVAEFFMWIFQKISRRLRFAITAAAIILFAIMVGAGATVIRASIMTLLVLFAKSQGRMSDISRALVFAAFLMILQNPRILMFDYSFALSFLSTCALIYIAPIIERLLVFITDRWKLRELVVSTLSTQLFVLPLLLYRSGDISVVSLPVNLLVLPFVSITMFSGFVTVVVSFVSHALSIPFSLLSYALLHYELTVVHLFASFKVASFHVAHFPMWLMILFYAFFITLIMRFRTEKKFDV